MFKIVTAYLISDLIFIISNLIYYLIQSVARMSLLKIVIDNTRDIIGKPVQIRWGVITTKVKIKQFLLKIFYLLVSLLPLVISIFQCLTYVDILSKIIILLSLIPILLRYYKDIKLEDFTFKNIKRVITNDIKKLLHK